LVVDVFTSLEFLNAVRERLRRGEGEKWR